MTTFIEQIASFDPAPAITIAFADAAVKSFVVLALAGVLCR